MVKNARGRAFIQSESYIVNFHKNCLKFYTFGILDKIPAYAIM